MAAEPDGSLRPLTSQENEHVSLTDEIAEMNWRDKLLLVCTAGEAAGLVFVPQYVGPTGSEQDQIDAREIDPQMNWNAWVDRAQEFLLRPAVRRHVEALADALMDHRTINGEQATEIIRSAM